MNIFKRIAKGWKDRKLYYTLRIDPLDQTIGFVGTRNPVVQLSAAMKFALDNIEANGVKGAQNYIEWVLQDATNPKNEFVLTLLRKDGLTPDERRRSTELDLHYAREELKVALEKLRAAEEAAKTRGQQAYDDFCQGRY